MEKIANKYQLFHHENFWTIENSYLLGFRRFVVEIALYVMDH